MFLARLSPCLPMWHTWRQRIPESSYLDPWSVHLSGGFGQPVSLSKKTSIKHSDLQGVTQVAPFFYAYRNQSPDPRRALSLAPTAWDQFPDSHRALSPAQRHAKSLYGRTRIETSPQIRAEPRVTHKFFFVRPYKFVMSTRKSLIYIQCPLFWPIVHLLYFFQKAKVDISTVLNNGKQW